MSTEASEPVSAFDDALAAMNAALKDLDRSVDIYLEQSQKAMNADQEIQRLASSSAKLARNLDDAENRAKQLSDANNEVSRRLVGALEMVRSVLEKQ